MVVKKSVLSYGNHFKQPPKIGQSGMFHHNGVKTSNALGCAFDGDETHPYNGKQTDQGDERQQPQNRCGGNHFISVHKFSPFYSSPCLRRTANWMMEITIKIRISTTPIAEAYPMLNTLKPDSYIYWNREELEVPGPGRM